MPSKGLFSKIGYYGDNNGTCFGNTIKSAAKATVMDLIGADNAAELLNNFYNGNGEDVTVSDNFIKDSEILQDAVKNNISRIKDISFTGKSSNTATSIKKLIDGEQEEIDIKDYWDTAYKSGSYPNLNDIDTSLALGSVQVRTKLDAKGRFIENENAIGFDGDIDSSFIDDYDFSTDPLTKTEYDSQEKGCGIPFRVNGSWREEVHGKAFLDNEGNITSTHIRTYPKDNSELTEDE